jgi:ribokinase
VCTYYLGDVIIVDILVIGSLNMDLVVNVERFPKNGETIRGSDLQMIPGGKGANQAAAAALLGASVSMVGRVGNDLYGSLLSQNLQDLGADISAITTDPQAKTGSAIILINSQGENQIVISPGANGQVGSSDVFKNERKIAKTKVLLLQLELPTSTVTSAIEIAHQKGITVILNPAPATNLPRGIYPMIDILIPNETEASFLTGIDVHDIPSASVAAEKLKAYGAKNVIITLGRNGSLLLTNNYCKHIPPLKVKIIDSTAAGDAFIGALAFAIVNGYSMEDAVQYANIAGGLTVTRKGAQTSLPKADEVNQMYEKVKKGILEVVK